MGEFSLQLGEGMASDQRHQCCQGPALEPGTLGNLGQFVQTCLGGYSVL